MFHEQQRLLLCGVLCLNSLFGAGTWDPGAEGAGKTMMPIGKLSMQRRGGARRLIAGASIQSLRTGHLSWEGMAWRCIAPTAGERGLNDVRTYTGTERGLLAMHSQHVRLHYICADRLLTNRNQFAGQKRGARSRWAGLGSLKARRTLSQASGRRAAAIQGMASGWCC